MGSIVKVRGIEIGKGKPKVCVALIGKTKELLIEEIKLLKIKDIDLVEWRMDYFEHIKKMEEVESTLNSLREALGEIPLLATFRTLKEGGEREISSKDYDELNHRVITSGAIDLVDIELSRGEQEVKQLITLAHQHNVQVILSSHDFEKTPSKAEIIARLCKMQQMEADLPKIAVMPGHIEDVLILLSATAEMIAKHDKTPIITMSMGKIGCISRMAGEIFGSALTFGTIGQGSAPGQIAVDKLKTVLTIIHEENREE